MFVSRSLHIPLSLMLVVLAGSEALAPASLFAQTATKTYYVATAGADNNPGSLEQPFQTIQRCASVMVAGDTCVIRAGTYRETVTPAASGQPGKPIVFTAYPGENVTVSGADVLGGWSVEQGTTYRTQMPWTVVDPAAGFPTSSDQIFVDGAMMTEARWPNIAVGREVVLRYKDNALADTATLIDDHQTTYTHSALSQFPTDYWKGAMINFMPGYGMVANTCAVGSNSGTSITLDCPSGTFSTGSLHRPGVGNAFFLWGKKGALDSAGEWFRAADGTLSLRLPDDSNPANHVIEAKRRVWAFQLNGRQHINVTGVNLFAASISTDLASSNVTLDSIEASYIWHFRSFILPAPYTRNGLYSMKDKGGIVLYGANHVLKNSTINYSAANAVSLEGQGHKLINNVMHGIGYAAGNDGISGSSGAPGNPFLLEHNTMFDVGRVQVFVGTSMNVFYNDLYNSHLQGNDMGVVYSWGIDGKGAQIAYNLVHDTLAEYNATYRHWGGHGIYMDDDTYNFLIYRNITWNTTNAGLYAMGNNGKLVQPNVPIDTPSNRKMYNNTVYGSIGAHAKDTMTPNQTLLGTEFKNNIGKKLNLSEPNLILASNIAADGIYVNQPAGDYRLRSGVSAIDAGVVLSPYTDGFAGSAPDIGALEYGSAMLSAGAVVRQQDLAGLSVACTPTIRTDTATCTITSLPKGRTMPSGFALRIGEATASTNCSATKNYTTHMATITCSQVSLGKQGGDRQIYVQLPGGAWVDTGTVSITSLNIGSITPPKGGSNGGTTVQLNGTGIDPTPTVYERPIQITNSTGKLLSDYQVRVTLDTASLIGQDKMRPDCGDLRFEDQGAALTYWLESGCNTTQTKVWLKLPQLPAGGKQLRVVYGDYRLTSASNGAGTFMFFDDFDDNQISTKWKVSSADASVVRETGGDMQIAGTTTAQNQYTPFGFRLDIEQVELPADFAIETAWRAASRDETVAPKLSVGGSDSVLSLYTTSPSGWNIGYWNGAAYVQAGTSTLTSVPGDWFASSIGYRSDGSVAYMENMQTRAQRTGMTNPDKGVFNYSPNGSNKTFDIRFGYVAVRSFVLPEPGAQVGAEQQRSKGMRVLLDGAPCLQLVAMNTSALQCKTPSHPAGTVDVTVIDADGLTLSLPQAFVYEQEAVLASGRVFMPLMRR